MLRELRRKFPGPENQLKRVELVEEFDSYRSEAIALLAESEALNFKENDSALKVLLAELQRANAALKEALDNLNAFVADMTSLADAVSAAANLINKVKGDDDEEKE